MKSHGSSDSYTDPNEETLGPTQLLDESGWQAMSDGQKADIESADRFERSTTPSPPNLSRMERFEQAFRPKTPINSFTIMRGKDGA